MLRMRLPLAGDVHELTDIDARQGANEGDQLAAEKASAVIWAQSGNSVVRLFVAKDDALDCPGYRGHSVGLTSLPPSRIPQKEEKGVPRATKFPSTKR